MNIWLHIIVFKYYLHVLIVALYFELNLMDYET